MVLKDGQLYECNTAISTAEAWTAAHWTAVTVGGEIATVKDGLSAVESDVTDLKEDKADIDGYYQDMAVGDAEQLISTVYTENSVPYNFRPTAGDGDRAYVDAVVGGSVVWNQLMQNGNFANGAFGWGGLGSWKSYEVVDGTLHLVSSANQVDYANVYRPIANGVKVNHVYVVSYYVKASKDSTTNGSLGTLSGGGGISGQVSYTANAWFHLCGLSKPTSYTDDQLYIRPKMTTDAEEVDVYLKNINCTDLTQMFGSTIADYVYGLETATAGAGVAWLKEHFPKIFDSGYIAYNAGTMVHVSGLSAKRTVGFNQWGEELEDGGLNTTTGAKEENSIQLRTKNFIRILPNMKYFYKAPSATLFARLYFYDATESLILYRGTSDWLNREITTPSNACYMKFVLNKAEYGTTYNHDICINLSDPARNGEYEPYEEHTYPLDNSLTLRGIPKLQDGKLYYDGDMYLPDGTVQRRYGIVDMGTLGWSRYNFGGTYVFYVNLPDKLSGYLADGICSKYVVGPQTSPANLADKQMDVKNNQTYIYVRDDSYTTETDFINAVTGSYLVYTLATPTTETAEPYQQRQIIDADGTEEFVSTSVVPVGHETRYPLDIRGRLDKLLSMPTSNGTYTLQATVTDGKVAYSWVSA